MLAYRAISLFYRTKIDMTTRKKMEDRKKKSSLQELNAVFPSANGPSCCGVCCGRAFSSVCSRCGWYACHRPSRKRPCNGPETQKSLLEEEFTSFILIWVLIHVCSYRSSFRTIESHQTCVEYDEPRWIFLNRWLGWRSKNLTEDIQRPWTKLFKEYTFQLWSRWSRTHQTSILLRKPADSICEYCLGRPPMDEILFLTMTQKMGFNSKVGVFEPILYFHTLVFGHRQP